jgi:Thiamine pyrophosphate enzyme, N-terminal TPP binding domain
MTRERSSNAAPIQQAHHEPAPEARWKCPKPAHRALCAPTPLHGVKHIFGLCGDTSLPFYDALYRLDHGMQHILARDERSAAYMADVYARISGRIGVCEGPSGGGATYILPGLIEANESSSPLLAITTDVSVAARGTFPLTELDQRTLFRPVTKWNAMIDLPVQIPLLVRTAFQRMTTGKSGATHLSFPHSTRFSGGVCHSLSKASGGEDLEIEQPVACWDCSSFDFHATLPDMYGPTLIRDEVIQVGQPAQKRLLAPVGVMEALHHEQLPLDGVTGGSRVRRE